MPTQAALPPGVTKAQFAKAVAEYRAIVGAEHVMVDVEQLAPYTKIMIPDEDALHQPAGVIAPASVVEIQRILAVCNKYRIPVWTISTGRNFGYGSAAPATPGQMVLDLRRMNRIIEVDAELCTALVEPGVTYRQLQDYINEHKLPLWLNFPSSGPLAGPVGNTLERGMGYNRYSEQMAHFCGMEVVLADGQVVRTGMGGIEGGNSWQAYRWGYGPWHDGLFTQSNLGIVTKLGLWLMRAPASSLTVAVVFPDMEATGRGMDAMRQLRLDSVIENGLIGDSHYGMASLVRKSQIFPGPGAIPAQVWDGFCDAVGAPKWLGMTTLYGQEAQIAANLKIVREAFAAAGGLVMTEHELPKDKPSPLGHFASNQKGQLNLNEFGVYNFRGGGGSAWFSPLIPARGKDMIRSITLCRQVYGEFGFDYLGGFIFGYSGRHVDHITDLLFDRTNAEETKRAHACMEKLIKVHAEAGYAPYRINTGFMKQVAGIYGPAQQALNRRLKRALDPNGILAPGKSGIY